MFPAGNEFHIITEAEKQTFQLNDIQLKNAVTKYFGKTPTDVFLKAVTIGQINRGQIYIPRYNWQQVQVHMQSTRYKITDISSQPVIIASRYF